MYLASTACLHEVICGENHPTVAELLTHEALEIVHKALNSLDDYVTSAKIE